eukprot:9984014-Ditylum_brightwellii.AAC.1
MYGRNHHVKQSRCVPPSTTKRGQKTLMGIPTESPAPVCDLKLHARTVSITALRPPSKSAAGQGHKRQSGNPVDTFFKTIVGDFQGCNFQRCHDVLFLKNRFGTQRAC